MKLRSMMCVGAMALAAAAIADTYTDGKVCAWMRIDSTLPVTAVGVPWVDVGDPANNVKVADLVKTDGLTNGDKLYVYNSNNDGKWQFYQLSGSSWVGGTTSAASTPSALTVAGDPTAATIARGQALYLERQNPADPAYFYVYGAVGSALNSTSYSGANKYLVASPKAAAFTVTSAKISGASNKDVIQVPLAGGTSRIYQYFTKQGKWRCNGKWQDETGYEGTIPLGTGFWYLASSTSAITFNW